MTCSIHSASFFSDHLKKHLNYWPFVCLTCRRTGTLTRFSSILAAAQGHVQQHHASTSLDVTMSRGAKMFARVLSIQKIEDIIKSNCITRQALFSESAAASTAATAVAVAGLSPAASTVTRHQKIHIPSANHVRRDQAPPHTATRSSGIAGVTNLRVITEGNRMVLKRFHPKSKQISKSIPQPQVCRHRRQIVP